MTGVDKTRADSVNADLAVFQINSP
jgi:hypothetical protein